MKDFWWSKSMQFTIGMIFSRWANCSTSFIGVVTNCVATSDVNNTHRQGKNDSDWAALTLPCYFWQLRNNFKIPTDQLQSARKVPHHSLQAATPGLSTTAFQTFQRRLVTRQASVITCSVDLFILHLYSCTDLARYRMPTKMDVFSFRLLWNIGCSMHLGTKWDDHPSNLGTQSRWRAAIEDVH